MAMLTIFMLNAVKHRGDSALALRMTAAMTDKPSCSRTRRTLGKEM